MTEHGENLRQNDTYVHSLAQALSSGASLASVPGLLKQVIRNEMWRKRYVKQVGHEVEYKRFTEFVEDYPPEGLHTTMSTLMKICKDYEDMEAIDLLAQVSAEKRGAPIGNLNASKTNVDNVNNCFVERESPTGNSAAYTMRRLSKDYPAIHEQVIEGDLSPHEAAIKAGFRKRKFQMPADDPRAAGRYLAERVDREWFEAMMDAYYKGIEE